MTGGTNGYKEMRKNLSEALKRASLDGKSWEEFLTFYGHHTNLPFTSAMCAWAERPEAGEIRPFAEWSCDRWKVKKGEHGILGQDVTAPGKHLYLFDQSQVEPGTDKEGNPLAPPAPLRDWTIVAKHADTISAMTFERPSAYELNGIAPAVSWFSDMACKRAMAVFGRMRREPTEAERTLIYKSALYAAIVRAGENPAFDIGDADVASVTETGGDMVAVGKGAAIITEACSDYAWQIASYLDAAYGNLAEAACAHILVPKSAATAAEWLMQDDGRVVEIMARDGKMQASVLSASMMPTVTGIALDFVRPEKLSSQVAALGFEPSSFDWTRKMHAGTIIQMLDTSLREAAGGDPCRASIADAARTMHEAYLDRADSTHAITSGMQYYCARELAMQVDDRRMRWGLEGDGEEVMQRCVSERYGRALEGVVTDKRGDKRKGRNTQGAPAGSDTDAEPGEIPEAVLRNDEIARRALGREPNRVRYEGEARAKKMTSPETSPTKDEIEAREAAAAAAAVGRRAQKTRSVRK